MHSIIGLLLILWLSDITSAFSLLSRSPKGGGGGGGGRGGGGGGGSSGRGSSSGGSGAGRGGSGDTGHSAISYGTASTGTRSANYFGGGGGRPMTLSEASAFSGRQMGGGVRSDVPGTRAFGSGYTYYVGDVRRTGVVGQPFPFGFWPIYWAGHGHSDEYGANQTIAAQRPGGEQVLVQLVPNITDSSWNTTIINGINETYWMIGDRESVTTLLSVLVDTNTTDEYGCNVQNLTISSFNSSALLEPVHFENVIQWYRSSSFALAFQGYNNSYAFPSLNETSSLGWNDSTPLPDPLQYSPFLQCINETITAALPILDGEPSSTLSNGQIAGITVGSVLASMLLCCCAIPCIRAIKERLKNSRNDRKWKARSKTLSEKPKVIVVDSPIETHKVPDGPSSFGPSSFSQQSYASSSTQLPHLAYTTPLTSTFVKSGRESFYSSRTLVEPSTNKHEYDKNRSL